MSNYYNYYRVIQVIHLNPVVIRFSSEHMDTHYGSNGVFVNGVFINYLLFVAFSCTVLHIYI